MARCTPYGTAYARLFDAIHARHHDFKVTAFCTWAARRAIRITPQLFAEWEAGRAHLPFDVALLLAKYLRDPEAVFGDALAELDHEITAKVYGDEPPAEIHALVMEVPGAGAKLFDVARRAIADNRITVTELAECREASATLRRLAGDIDRLVESEAGKIAPAAAK